MRIRWVCLLLVGVMDAAWGKDRVQTARVAHEATVKAWFANAKVNYPPQALYLRAFKHEAQLEIWAGDTNAPLSRIRTLPFCYASGDLGPKRREGDLQVPEGFYEIDQFNPRSNYLLSMRVSYPNATDRLLGAKGQLGGDIYIHGDCVSIGCISLGDEAIQQLYVLVLDFSQARKAHTPIHIFPRRMDERGMAALAEHPAASRHSEFWKTLVGGYRSFESSRKIPRVKRHVKTGAYVVDSEKTQ